MILGTYLRQYQTLFSENLFHRIYRKNKAKQFSWKILVTGDINFKILRVASRPGISGKLEKSGNFVALGKS